MPRQRSDATDEFGSTTVETDARGVPGLYDFDGVTQQLDGPQLASLVARSSSELDEPMKLEADVERQAPAAADDATRPLDGEALAKLTACDAPDGRAADPRCESSQIGALTTGRIIDLLRFVGGGAVSSMMTANDGAPLRAGNLDGDPPTEIVLFEPRPRRPPQMAVQSDGDDSYLWRLAHRTHLWMRRWNAVLTAPRVRLPIRRDLLLTALLSASVAFACAAIVFLEMPAVAVGSGELYGSQQQEEEAEAEAVAGEMTARPAATETASEQRAEPAASRPERVKAKPSVSKARRKAAKKAKRARRVKRAAVRATPASAEREPVRGPIVPLRSEESARPVDL